MTLSNIVISKGGKGKVTYLMKLRSTVGMDYIIPLNQKNWDSHIDNFMYNAFETMGHNTSMARRLYYMYNGKHLAQEIMDSYIPGH